MLVAEDLHGQRARVGVVVVVDAATKSKDAAGVVRRDHGAPGGPVAPPVWSQIIKGSGSGSGRCGGRGYQRKHDTP